jgi:hypothetical protein
MKRMFPHLMIALPWIWACVWITLAWRAGGSKEDSAVTAAIIGGFFTVIEAIVQCMWWENHRDESSSVRAIHREGQELDTRNETSR